jgi:energy-coupling factor transporter ATP-binding protein EcfA2
MEAVDAIIPLPTRRGFVTSKAIPSDGLDIQKDFDDRILIYGPAGLCSTSEQLLTSKAFLLVLGRFLEITSAVDCPTLACVREFKVESADAEHPAGYDIVRISGFLRTLLDNELYTIPFDGEHKPIQGRDPEAWRSFIEQFYGYWRKRERFILFGHPRKEGPLVSEEVRLDFLRQIEDFKILVLTTYRRLRAKAMNGWFAVFRQISAGAHVGLVIQKRDWDAPKDYQHLLAVPMVRMAMLYPPVIYYTRSNKRQGQYGPLKKNPAAAVRDDSKAWLCYPAKVGTLVILIYFRKEYLSHLAGLANLFEVATEEDLVGKRPDGIVIFGVPPESLRGENVGYFEDAENKLLVGAVAHKTGETDYFGYFKKTALTVHNLVMIARGRLPLHGAMVKIDLVSGKTAHVVLVGDSGAGKSETLEALRVVADKSIRQLTVIFDDMGSLGIEADGRVTAHGTEVGAFVRLDDLHPGYVYAEMERSVLMNPHLTNARIVIPITQYRHVVAGYPVDFFLYANNYEPVDERSPALDILADPKQVLDVFSQGARLAKGTTDEKGLVSTYFANPFGASQMRKEHEVLAERFVTQLLRNGRFLGQVRTQLGRDGCETQGPQTAARALFDHLTKNL